MCLQTLIYDYKCISLHPNNIILDFVITSRPFNATSDHMMERHSAVHWTSLIRISFPLTYPNEDHYSHLNHQLLDSMFQTPPQYTDLSLYVFTPGHTKEITWFAPSNLWGISVDAVGQNTGSRYNFRVFVPIHWGFLVYARDKKTQINTLL